MISYEWCGTVWGYSRLPPQADLRTAVRVQGLAEAIEASGRLKHPVELSPVGLPVGI